MFIERLSAVKHSYKVQLKGSSDFLEAEFGRSNDFVKECYGHFLIASWNGHHLN